MARWLVDGETLTLKLSRWEAMFGLHRSITVPISRVTAVEEVDDPWKHHLHGFRAPGTGFPYVIMLGTMRYQGMKDFCAVYRRVPAAMVTLSNCEFTRLIASGPAPSLPGIELTGMPAAPH